MRHPLERIAGLLFWGGYHRISRGHRRREWLPTDTALGGCTLPGVETTIFEKLPEGMCYLGRYTVHEDLCNISLSFTTHVRPRLLFAPPFLSREEFTTCFPRRLAPKYADARYEDISAAGVPGKQKSTTNAPPKEVYSSSRGPPIKRSE